MGGVGDCGNLSMCGLTSLAQHYDTLIAESLGGRAMKLYQVIGISIMAGLIGLFLSNLVLPAIVGTLEPTLMTLDVVDAANIISWAAILITFAGLALAIPVIGKHLKIGPLYAVLAMALVASVVMLAAGSFLYLYFEAPEVYAGTTIWLRLAKFYTHPTLVILTIGDPEPVWWISTGLFVFTFNLGVYFLTEVD
jgi:hypothetical protein